MFLTKKMIITVVTVTLQSWKYGVIENAIYIAAADETSHLKKLNFSVYITSTSTDKDALD